MNANGVHLFTVLTVIQISEMSFSLSFTEKRQIQSPFLLFLSVCSWSFSSSALWLQLIVLPRVTYLSLPGDRERCITITCLMRNWCLAIGREIHESFWGIFLRDTLRQSKSMTPLNLPIWKYTYTLNVQSKDGAIRKRCDHTKIKGDQIKIESKRGEVNKEMTTFLCQQSDTFSHFLKRRWDYHCKKSSFSLWFVLTTMSTMSRDSSSLISSWFLPSWKGTVSFKDSFWGGRQFPRPLLESLDSFQRVMQEFPNNYRHLAHSVHLWEEEEDVHLLSSNNLLQ